MTGTLECPSWAEGFSLHKVDMSRKANDAFKRLLHFKDDIMPEVYKNSAALLPNHGALKSAFQRLDASIEDYIDKMPPLPKSPSPRRAVARTPAEGNVSLPMSHDLEGKLGGRRRTYRKRGRKQKSRRRR